MVSNCNAPRNDDELLKVPLRSGASPSVISMLSDPESCIDGITMYGFDDRDDDRAYSIGEFHLNF